MADLSKINEINLAIEEYFTANPSATVVPVKELMPLFISKGIFTKDVKKGKPIREVIRLLDKTGELSKIPSVCVERSEKAAYWYFSATQNETQTINIVKEAKKEKLVSDEKYVLDICDSILGVNSKRQHKFKFLVGDKHKDGKSETKLPIDAYYEEFKLAIEYVAKPYEDEEVIVVKRKRSAKKLTPSGVIRSEQRKIYDKRKQEVLPQNNITLIYIRSKDFQRDENNKIIRNKISDTKTIKSLLKNFI